MSSNTLPDITTLWKHSDPAASQAAFMELMPGAETGGNISFNVTLLTQVARAQGLQRNHEAANASLDRAKRMLDEGNPQELQHALVSYLLERGRVYRASGYEDRAEDYFLEAYEMALDAEEIAMAVDAAHMLGLTLQGKESVDWFSRALKHASSGINAQVRRWEAPLCELLGRIYAEEGRSDEAKRLFESAVILRSRQPAQAPEKELQCSGVACACPESVADGSLLVP